jgi:hypothetical protein
MTALSASDRCHLLEAADKLRGVHLPAWHLLSVQWEQLARQSRLEATPALTANVNDVAHGLSSSLLSRDDGQAAARPSGTTTTSRSIWPAVGCYIVDGIREMTAA